MVHVCRTFTVDRSVDTKRSKASPTRWRASELACQLSGTLMVVGFPMRERVQGRYIFVGMATFRSAAALVSADGTRTPGTAALFTEPGRKGHVPPWAGDFRLATGLNGIKDAVGKTLTLEMPDGRSGKVLVQSQKGGKGGITLALLGEDLAPF